MISVLRLFRGTLRSTSHLLEVRPKPFLHRLCARVLSPIHELIGIFAIVEKLLASVTLIANVDVIAFSN